MTRFGSTHRRGFLGRVVAGAAALTLPWEAAAAAQVAAQGAADKWLARLTGKHRCFFDFPEHNAGLPLLHIYNYLETYQRAYNVPDSEINTIGTLYFAGPTASLPMGFNDAMWAKYKFGEMLNLTDPKTGRPSERNLFNHPQAGDPVLFNGAVPGAGIEALQKRGLILLMCNNALNFLVNQLAQAGHGTAAAIGAELRANLLPDIEVVPAMVIAIEQAQARGVAYNRQ
jgi:intracellular sulfur oxidation DsrE/DsrF family protein